MSEVLQYCGRQGTPFTCLHVELDHSAKNRVHLFHQTNTVVFVPFDTLLNYCLPMDIKGKFEQTSASADIDRVIVEIAFRNGLPNASHSSFSKGGARESCFVILFSRSWALLASVGILERRGEVCECLGFMQKNPGKRS